MQEQRLLALAARDMRDNAIADELGIGLRTVERDMRTLMGRLGARTRFEAGVRAAERGWLEVS